MSQEQFYFEFKLLQKELPKDLCLEDLAFKYNSTGIEEFALEEQRVDEILGQRSYSGGDLPQSILDEVEHTLDLGCEKLYKIYFQTLEDSNNFKNHLSSLLNIDISFEKKSTQDWNEEWRKHYSPIQVSESLEIIPSWLEDYKSICDKQLYIYPGMGFGTGGHETTFLCLKAYIDYKHLISLQRCLDFGCGSGILGLATLLFNPKCHVDLYDIDDEALVNCQQNIDLNKLNESSIQLLGSLGKQKIQGKYEVVFANILQNVLLSEQKIIIDSVADNGILILSGLLDGQQAQVIKEYKEYDNRLEVLQVYQKNDWLSIALRKN